MNEPQTEAETSAETEAAMTAAAPMFLDHLNGGHGDSLLLVARILGGRSDAREATATGIDLHGIDIRIDDDVAPTRIAFARSATRAGEVSILSLLLVTAARERSGEPGLTSIEREIAERSSIPTLFTEVVRVQQLSPHLRRITFGGGDVADFRWLSADQFMYVLLPPAGRSEMSIDRSFTWEQAQQMPKQDQPRGAYYTVRHHRPDHAEIDMDFVLHGDDGPVSAWARSAKPGDKAALWGPRTAFEPPPDTDWYLLVADETGLPGVGAIIEALPAGTPVVAVIEVADEQERQPLRADSAISVQWIHRGHEAPGTTTNLIDALRTTTLPDGNGYAWGGGESRAVTAVRKYLRQELGYAREQVSMVGYWRHADHIDDHDPDD